MDGLEHDQLPVRKRALSPLEEAVALAEAGDRATARDLFRRIIQHDMNNEDAWLWLAWTAETKAQSVRYLKEAQIFFPDSERIDDAMNWVRDDGEKAQSQPASQDEPSSHFGVSEPEPGLDWEPESERRRTRRSVHLPDLSWLSALSSRFATLGARLRRMDWRRWDVSFFQRMAKPLAILFMVAILVGIAVLGIVNARNAPRVVMALELPPRVVDATPTPSISQRTKDLWVDVEKQFMREDWDNAIETLERIREIDPTSEQARDQLGLACYYRAKECIEENVLDQASVDLDRAIRLNAESKDLQQTRRELHTYMAGRDALQSKSWQDAIASLERVYAWNPQFRDARLMLADAYYEHGRVSKAAGDEFKINDELQDASQAWVAADEAFDRSLELDPENEEIKAQSEQVKDIITPPKRIEVDLSSKLCTLYENHQPIRVFVICSGRTSAPTLPGRYNIKTKMPMAYASKWDLDMPWWLGIYDAGGSENGFHALPILSSGVTLWRSALGTGCSYGCIVLDTADAIELYNWAEMGDVVFVRY